AAPQARRPANLPAAQRWIQQGNELSFRQPERARADAVSSHDPLSLSKIGTVSASRRPRRIPHPTGPSFHSQYPSEPLMPHIRFAAAACQTDLANPIDRSEMARNTDRMLSMVDSAVGGGAPFLPVRLVVFPEFAHSAPIYSSVQELLDRLAVAIPNEHTERLQLRARQYDIYIQSGSMLEADDRWPGRVFNTTCLIGPEGIVYKYRKVNTWIPYEVHSSPHDLEGYDEPLFPVADTPIGRL